MGLQKIKIFDGAFGTYYMAQTGDTGLCELANVTNPARVSGIHLEYLNCGVDAIKTNTFRANAESFPNAETLANVITAGYNLAKEAARGTKALVYSDIGGINDEDTAEESYAQIAEIFLSLGAGNFLFETLPHFCGIEAAAKTIKNRNKNANIIVSFSVSQDGYTSKGIHFKNLAGMAAESPFIDAVGLNCTCGPAHLINLIKNLGHITKPLSVMPNAGYPSIVNGRTVFNDNADYFGEKLSQLARLGATILGGCCGTTPTHIRQAINALNTLDSFKSLISSSSQEDGSQGIFSRAPYWERNSNIGVAPHGELNSNVGVPSSAQYGDLKPNDCARSALSEDSRPRIAYLPDDSSPYIPPSKPLYVELDPPLNCDTSFLFSSADRLKSFGVSAITLADSPLARSRADSVLTAARLRIEKNIDVLPHITCRDKNAIALRGSLLGAHSFGINKVLIVTGDRPAEDGVFSFNSVKLISYINNLNNDIFGDRPFEIGGALNVNAVNFDAELNRACLKIKNGAGFLLTQPIFSEDAVANFNRAAKELDCKLFAGILPLAGYKNAVFLNNEVAGIKIPDATVETLKDKKNAAETSVKLSSETIRAVYDRAYGFYIMTPLKKTELVCSLIERCFND